MSLLVLACFNCPMFAATLFIISPFYPIGTLCPIYDTLSLNLVGSRGVGVEILGSGMFPSKGSVVASNRWPTPCVLIRGALMSYCAITTSTNLTTGETLFADYPFKVADLSPETVAFDRKEIELAEHEMRAGGDAKSMQARHPLRARVLWARST